MNAEMTTQEIAALRKAIEAEAKRRYYEAGKKSPRIRDIAIELTLSGWRPEDPALVCARLMYSALTATSQTEAEGGMHDECVLMQGLVSMFRAGVEHGKAL